ncbi:hypothetical protein POM88_015003 [Heracleum sosnowskyi]|uniref:Transposase n=1 Tax=Heracleum sosnowskyi TaxID=360622 RepID=A0AAD8IJD9_9APIA|nr:hypothetical protein POM88_015003 [Heracleum sosnowskyi]
MFKKVLTDDDNGENAHKSGDNMDAEGTEKGNAVMRSKKYTVRKRVINVKGTNKGKKKINVDNGTDDSGNESWYDSEDDSANESSDVGGLNDNYSDEEFADMRTIREEIKKEHDQLFNEQSQFIKYSFVGYKNTYERMFNDNNSTDNGNIYGMGSQEKSDVDENYAYVGPSTIGKNKRVNEPFNPCTSGKDIKWRCGLIFGSKQELKTVVMVFSIAIGRPLRYRVDGQHMIHVVCAEGCPFRMWVSYMEKFEGWQIKTLFDDYNCIYHFSNKLVTVKYLADLYGDRIGRNHNWKLSEMKEEFMRVLKVEVCDAKCCRVRKRALSGVEEEMKKHYSGLRRFGGEILRSNKENTVKICTTRVNE